MGVVVYNSSINPFKNLYDFFILCLYFTIVVTSDLTKLKSYLWTFVPYLFDFYFLKRENRFIISYRVRFPILEVPILVGGPKNKQTKD